MFELFSNLEYVQAYINDLLVMSCSPLEKHLKHLEKVLSQLNDAGLIGCTDKTANLVGIHKPEFVCKQTDKTNDTHVRMLSEYNLWQQMDGHSKHKSQINIHFAKFEIEYLGYWITWQGIQPLPKKVEAFQNIAPPANKQTIKTIPWNSQLLSRHVDTMIGSPCTTHVPYTC